MKHYEDLIQRLRTATKLPLLQALMNEAADAIEELQKHKDLLEMMQAAGGLWGFLPSGEGRWFTSAKSFYEDCKAAFEGGEPIFEGVKAVRVNPEKEKLYDFFLYDRKDTSGGQYMRHLSGWFPARSDEEAIYLIAKDLVKAKFLVIYEVTPTERRKLKVEEASHGEG